jgi:GT2 family glycosyltransferase
MSTSILPLTVIVPTFRREQVLVDTLTDLLSLNQAPTEILVLDQTEKHEPETNEFLTTQAGLGKIRWLRLHEPSIPKAMNRGLLEASQDIVLFVDDDIRPEPDLLKAHLSAHANQPGGLIAGRVIQPWQENSDPIESAGIQAGIVKEFIGCNFSVRRDLAIKVGGFDENFVRVAYRYEAEFAHRYRASGRQIYFEPLACLHHLKDVKGGTRTYGDHLTTWRPDHAVGAYYFGLRTRTMREFLVRPFRAITTRYHLRHPWRIPVTLLAELGGMLWALGLFMRGPKHLESTEKDTA